jgi:ABC-type transporter Mla maintaining outer membrane lipid asymmetry ATPase subunit MlaF
MTAPLLEISAISMKYGALRPLRLEQLAIAAGDHVALVGLDQPAAEVLINLVTGASLPDTGSVRVFGRLTAEITDSADWLTTVDRFGIVSERAALLEPMSVIQNLAVPFSLEIEPPPPAIAVQAAALASEVGVPETAFERRVGDLDAAMRMRVRLGRALAFNPAVLLLEHPSATLPRHEVARFARDVRAVAARRELASLSITADLDFAASASTRTLVLDPASGRLRRR